ncbi:hypothetical protein K445DRAFT_319431 [Daldinia sp. EC12]|nr:hypothetical protein K445DRAFT_319431 [Daldinia sp. EC12]
MVTRILGRTAEKLYVKISSYLNSFSSEVTRLERNFIISIGLGALFLGSNRGSPVTFTSMASTSSSINRCLSE